ncbi:MAG: hypothetical protein ABIY50_03765 [Ignavibacteria bacterium]
MFAESNIFFEIPSACICGKHLRRFAVNICVDLRENICVDLREKICVDLREKICVDLREKIFLADARK